MELVVAVVFQEYEVAPLAVMVAVTGVTVPQITEGLEVIATVGVGFTDKLTTAELVQVPLVLVVVALTV